MLLVHSPDAEKKFMADGYGVNRRLVMHNDFIIVGPGRRPGQDQGHEDGRRGLQEDRRRQAPSSCLAGDNSGTHAKEKELWKAAGINPEGQKWYQQTGLGMGQTLNVAAEKKGYTLADRGTYLALKKNLGLDILVEGDAILLNIYHVIEVNPQKWPKVNAAGGKAFADFMVSKETQDVIKTFGVEKFGSPLFFPDAGKKVEDLGQIVNDGSHSRGHQAGLQPARHLRPRGAGDHLLSLKVSGTATLHQPVHRHLRRDRSWPSRSSREASSWSA